MFIKLFSDISQKNLHKNLHKTIVKNNNYQLLLLIAGSFFAYVFFIPDVTNEL